MAGRAVANHADVERLQYTKHLFTHAAGFGQVVANQRHQRQAFFDFNPAQGRQFHQQRLR